MVVTVIGIVTNSNPEHPLKAYFPIAVTDNGNKKDFKVVFLAPLSGLYNEYSGNTFAG